MNSRDPNAVLPILMPDVQGAADQRRLVIQRVGVRGLRYPGRWQRDDGSETPTVAQWNLYVALPAEQKGTHMSRFVALLEELDEPLSVPALARLHSRMLERLTASAGRIEVEFPLFLRKTAPVSGVASLLDYQVALSIDGEAGDGVATVRVVVPVTSLCPCSKTISDYGAHNQRSHVTVSVTLADDVRLDLADLIALIEEQASCELYGLLKRVDEKYVTERAYDNPKFVEDLVRDVAARVREVVGDSAFSVEAENFESIHNHSAYARIDG
ncbi:MAG TPA: GTP cyclohydrolase FolE2 [Burkholderiaceae bacterium]|nr:GTP cyclohydrolase FolE2 [Burkholderiaceae bacterium]